MGRQASAKRERWKPFVRGGLAPHVSPEFQEAWVNNKYTVYVSRADTPIGPMVHLSIKRHDRSAARDWRHFQRIKNELVGEDAEAVELYPAEARLVDMANQYHLWCLLPPNRFPFGYTTRDVCDEATGRAALRALGMNPTGMRQRPFDEEIDDEDAFYDD